MSPHTIAVDTPEGAAADSRAPANALVEVLAGGPMTTVQDLPGRVGYWDVGVPPNGPMDDLSHALVNRILGNRPTAAALELTGAGPTLRFSAPAGGFRTENEP